MSDRWKLWLGPLWSGKSRNLRFFGEEGGEGGGEGGEGGDGGEGEPPWHSAYEVSDDDRKILDKYKTADDAIHSIPHRERRLSDLKIDFPADDATPEDREKGHRAILRRMGLPKKADGYKDKATALLDALAPNVRKTITDEAIQNTYEQAHELGLLPWQYERMLKAKLDATAEQVNAQEDNQVAAQDKLEKAVKLRWRLQHKEHTQNAELMAAHLDEFIQGNPLGLEGEDGTAVKDAVSQLLKGGQNPVLYAIFDHLHDLLLSEGDGTGTRRFGAEANDAYSKGYQEAKARWPNRGEDFWKSFARQKAGGGR